MLRRAGAVFSNTSFAYEKISASIWRKQINNMFGINYPNKTNGREKALFWFPVVVHHSRESKEAGLAKNREGWNSLGEPLEASLSSILQKPGGWRGVPASHREALCLSGAMVTKHHRLGCLKRIVLSPDSGAKVRDQSVGR